jgi:hypothetical protein
MYSDTPIRRALFLAADNPVPQNRIADARNHNLICEYTDFMSVPYNEESPYSLLPLSKDPQQMNKQVEEIEIEGKSTQKGNLSHTVSGITAFQK